MGTETVGAIRGDAQQLRVLLVGLGARDHALTWAFAKSPLLGELHAAPGNAGMADLAVCHPDVDIFDFAAITDLARECRIDLVVASIEDLLVDGLASHLEAAGIACLGPSGQAAMLEGSKRFSKQLMDDVGIATAPWRTYTAYGDAIADIERWTGPVAVKADGLAAGCGAYVCHTPAEAFAAVETLFAEGAELPPGGAVVVEELIAGREASIMALTDGTNVMPLPVARDYKRLGDGDAGPNTGGMGAYCPSVDVSTDEAAELCEQIVQPIVDELRRRGTPFRGVIFAGVMLTDDGPMVLEYNCRFGNPETQALVRVLDGDLLDLVHRAAVGELTTQAVASTGRHAVAISVAAPSYPDLQLEPAPVTVTGVRAAQAMEGVEVFIGFADRSDDDDDTLVTQGGRFVTITATAGDLTSARRLAYQAVQHIECDGAHHRSDIAHVGVGAAT